MKNNTTKYHIEVLNEEMGEVRNCQKDIKKDVGIIKEDMVGVKTDLEWIKKLTFIVVSSSIGAFIMGLFNLLNK